MIYASFVDSRIDWSAPGILGFDAQQLLLVSALAGALVFVAIVIQRLMKHRVAARWFSLLWILVLIRFVLFVAPESPSSWMNLVPERAVAVESTIVMEPVEAFVESELPIDTAVFPVEEMAWVEPVVTPSSFNGNQIVLLIWMTGMVFIAGLLIPRLVRCVA